MQPGPKSRVCITVLNFSNTLSVLYQAIQTRKSKSCLFYKQLFRERLSEKRARDNPEKYCGWFVRSLFFKEISSEKMRSTCSKSSHGHMFASAKVGSKATVVRKVIISYFNISGCRVHIFPTTYLEIAV